MIFAPALVEVNSNRLDAGCLPEVDPIDPDAINRQAQLDEDARYDAMAEEAAMMDAYESGCWAW